MQSGSAEHTIGEELFKEKLYDKARYIASLVQGSQALEGAALDKEGYERLVEYAADLLRKGDPQKVLYEDHKITK